VQLIAWSIPAFVAFMLLEAAIARRRRVKVYRLAVALSDLSCGITSQLFNLLTFTASVAIYAGVYQWRLWDLDPGAGWVWLLGMLGVDLLYYWWHRASHEVNILWAAHVVHHQSEDYNLAVALRQALLTGFTSLPFFLPLALLGVPPIVYGVSKALNTLYQFWIHTELVGRLGPVDRVINTPSNHRVHHAINPQYLDKNYAGILMVWDRVFGSFEPEGERPVYGITKPLRSLNPLWANVHYFVDIARLSAAATSWRDRLRAWVAHPAWRPGLERSAWVAPVGPEELIRRAAHHHDVRTSRGLALYITVQAALGIPLTMLLLIEGPTLTLAERLAGVLLIGLATVGWAGLFERRAWAWPLELLLVATGAAIVYTTLG
jgi:alkylglycerol monooxygenase